MVEVIVSAVIVAVLSAVAVPIYRGYVDQTEQETVDNLAVTAAASARSFRQKTGQTPAVNDLNLFMVDPARFTIGINAGTRTITIQDNQSSRTAQANY